ncbi:MAG: cytidine deaminase [Fimbriimonadaceae bacterium]|jgi:cytidine deaminase|nr:cytidine deaminase [Fimbriimonadaceae bacterium]
MTRVEDLIVAARGAKLNAYAPYSVYSVGAAVLGADNQVYTGCNVENISYGLTICAERTALVKMVSNGCRAFSHIVIATKDGGTPCGACRQFMAEFCQKPDQVFVICISDSGQSSEFTLSELLPHSFSSDLRKTQN